jgi:arylsulfatase A-like enzyme
VRQLLVLGSLVGLAYAGLETAAASAGGSVHPVPQLAVHLVLAVLATALAALLLGAVGIARERRAALGAAIAAGSLVAGSLFLRSHFAFLASQRWTSAGHALALTASVAAGAALAWGLARGFARLRGRWVGSRPAAACATGLLVVAAPVSLIALDGWGEPELGTAGLDCDAPYDVLVITLDTLRRDHLTHYGYARPTSQALERFGFSRFEHGFAVSSWTRPATASLLTGLYPSKHTAVERANRLPSSARTLAEILAARGFATGFCAGNLNASGVFGMDQGASFTTGDPDRPPHVLAGTALGEVLQRRRISLQDARDLNRFALAFLRAARGRRYFLYVHYDDPHKPYAPPAELLRRYAEPFEGRVLTQPIQGPMTPAEVEHMVARYDADVENAVLAAARLLEEIERQGTLDTTLIVFTADHGEAFGEHGRWNHANSVYDELVAIPLLVRPPSALGGVPVVRQPASQVDVVPTVLDYLGLELPAGLDGRSLRPWLEGASEGERRLLLAECARTQKWSCRSERYKLIAPEEPGQGSLEIYDMSADPGELSNLAGRAELQPVVDELFEKGRSARAKLAEGRLMPELRSLAGQLQRRLNALGYVE